MDKATRRRLRKRQKRIDYILLFGFTAIAMFAWSYYLFTTQENCSYGGSKLSFIFAILCENFGAKGQAFMALILGFLFGAATWDNFSEGKKSNK